MFSLVFQILAIDHQWHPDQQDVYGIPGTSGHAMHCHGNSGCADGGGIAVVAIPEAPRLSSTLPTRFDAIVDVESPNEPFVGVPFEPPRV